MKSLLDLKNKLDISSFGNLHLYLYLACAYLKFFIFGNALNFPLVIQIQTQSFCNGRCQVCPYPIVKEKLPQGTMEWELYTELARQAASEPMLCHLVCMLQNEPLIDKRIFDSIKYFKSLNGNKKAKIVTNGELLDRYNSSDIVQSGLDFLNLSLNAKSKDTYMKVNPGLDYEKVMANISSLLSDKSLKRKLTLNFLNTKMNSREIREAEANWRKKGVRTQIVEMTNRAGSLNEYERLRSLEVIRDGNIFSRLRGRFLSGMRRLLGCNLPFCQMAVLFNGDVIVCCHDWNRDTVVGNVRNSSLKEIWNSEKMNQIRRSILRKRYNEMKSCAACSQAV